MSWTKITCFFAFCALLAAPVMADPTLSVDLARKGNGTPQLNANGNFEYIVTITPDAALFDTPTDGDHAGVLGDALAFEAGFGLSLSENDATSTYSGSFLLDALKAGATVGSETDAVGTPIFAWETTGSGSGGAFAEGLQMNAATSEVFAALGTLYLTNASAGAGQFQLTDGGALVMTIEAPGPVDGVADTILSTRLQGSGAYAGMGRVAQDDPSSDNDFFDNFSADVQFRTIGGDANLDGTTNSADFGDLQNNYNSSGTNWATGDFNGDGNTNSADFGILQNNYNTTAPAPIGAVGVPEPSTALLGLVSLLGIGFAARKRS